jgi:hypothetical protein
MHAQSNPQLITQPTDNFVLEQLPSGEYASLRPARVIDVAHVALPQDARFDITDAGRRALATEALFGSWPSVAEASA